MKKGAIYKKKIYRNNIGMLITEFNKMSNTVIDIGVLDDKTFRARDNEWGKMVPTTRTNAEVGRDLELGIVPKGMTQPRSFLRTPMIDHFKAVVNTRHLFWKRKSGKITSKQVGVLMERDDMVSSIKEFLNNLGKNALEVVRSSFHNQGFGKWAANKPSTMAKKLGNKLGRDTAQLFKSLSYRLRKK